MLDYTTHENAKIYHISHHRVEFDDLEDHAGSVWELCDLLTLHQHQQNIMSPTIQYNGYQTYGTMMSTPCKITVETESRTQKKEDSVLITYC